MPVLTMNYKLSPLVAPGLPTRHLRRIPPRQGIGRLTIRAEQRGVCAGAEDQILAASRGTGARGGGADSRLTRRGVRG